MSLKTPIYPPSINSIPTKITSEISSTSLIITVENGDSLPFAPNIATLYNDNDLDSAETIKYSTKVDNILSGITRGFQGTAKSWDSNTNISRNFTAYDYTSFSENIEDLYLQIENIEFPSSSPISQIIRNNDGYITSIIRGIKTYTYIRNINNVIIGIEVN